MVVSMVAKLVVEKAVHWVDWMAVSRVLPSVVVLVAGMVVSLEHVLVDSMVALLVVVMVASLVYDDIKEK